MKYSIQDLKELFSAPKVTGYSKTSKHQASKKGHKHTHNLSNGERLHRLWIATKIQSSPKYPIS